MPANPDEIAGLRMVRTKHLHSIRHTRTGAPRTLSHLVAGFFVLAASIVGHYAMAQPATYSAAEIRATVVDADTGAPIAGAVVYAKWTLHTRMGFTGGIIVDQHEFETMTDEAGRFVIPGWGPKPRPIAYELIRGVPLFKIFKPGYYGQTYQNTRSIDPTASQIDSQWNGKALALHRFDGDWDRYVELLSLMYRRTAFECFRSCPRMIAAVYQDLDRIRPDAPKRLRGWMSRTPIEELEPADQEFLRPYFKGRPR